MYSAGDIGRLTEPVLLVVNGNVQFSNSTVNIFGLVYTRTADWVTSGAGGRITGAAIAEGGISGAGTPTIVYDADILRVLRVNTGSFVRVPGSWRDFQ